MNADENEIYEFFKKFHGGFVTVLEISRSVGPRRRFNEDRLWAKPVLRRMEAEGWLESNVYGEYRLKKRKEDDTCFLEALHQPGICLGDTTIISLKDVEEEEKEQEETQAQGTKKKPGTGFFF